MVQTTARCPGNWDERPRSGVNFCELLGAREGRGLGAGLPGTWRLRLPRPPSAEGIVQGDAAREEALLSV